MPVSGSIPELSQTTENAVIVASAERAVEPHRMSTALTPLVRSFVSHFGEMGSRWGINRTVGQIYALIYVSL
jgi:hypothetical protein